MVIGGIAALVLAGLLIWWGSGIAVGKSRLNILDDELHFPMVSGFNLMREEYVFPRDFQGEYNLVIIPFQQRQQRDVNTWIPAVQELERTIPGFAYYELPTIYKLPVISRTFINEGMRAGIPDQKARERTITLYLDKDGFKQALGVDSEQDIQLFLVNRQGEILWQEAGTYSIDKEGSLLAALEGLS